jgi:hypothetical protein
LTRVKRARNSSVSPLHFERKPDGALPSRECSDDDDDDEREEFDERVVDMDPTRDHGVETADDREADEGATLGYDKAASPPPPTPRLDERTWRCSMRNRATSFPSSSSEGEPRPKGSPRTWSRAAAARARFTAARRSPAYRVRWSGAESMSGAERARARTQAGQLSSAVVVMEEDRSRPLLLVVVGGLRVADEVSSVIDGAMAVLGERTVDGMVVLGGP